MSSDCRFHVAVTPYSKLTVPDGIKAVDVENFQPSILERRPWPRVGVQRTPEGGDGGTVLSENVIVSWIGDKLIYPHAENAQPLAEKQRYHNEILYLASYVAQLCGQVAYVPASASTYVILVEDRIAQIHAIRFTAQQVAVIDPFIKHSMPIPYNGHFEFTVWRRSINGSLQLNPDPAGLQRIIVNMNKVNRVNEIGVRKVDASKESTKKPPHLAASFSKDIRPLIEATAEAIEPFGQLIPDFSFHTEQVTVLPWPQSDGINCFSGALKQEFVMGWEPVDETGESFELIFEGLSGSLTGEKGRPGVEYSAELGTYKSDLIMARPDGSFYVQPFLHSEVFVIALALPDPETGEPIESSLKAFAFKNGNAIRLDPGVWHTVPIPLAGTGPVVFTEFVAETNAHVVANVKVETGHSIRFVQAV